MDLTDRLAHRFEQPDVFVVARVCLPVRLRKRQHVVHRVGHLIGVAADYFLKLALFCGREIRHLL